MKQLTLNQVAFGSMRNSTCLKPTPARPTRMNWLLASRHLPLYLIFLLTLGTGCHLGQPGSASFASVVIMQRSPAEIQTATARVFQADGYKAYATGSGQMLFEKEGTRANNLANNGLVGTHYGAQSLVRVRMEFVDLGGGSCRLQCQAFMVTNAGDSFFENEKRLANIRSGPYQDLLDKVAGSLKQP
jgi:hypothetical protein